MGTIFIATHRTGCFYIITYTNYLTRWKEVEPTEDCTTDTTDRLLWEDIVSRYGCPLILTSDWGTHVLNKMVQILLMDFITAHHKTTPYHP